MSKINNIDPNTNIIIRKSEETVGTAGGPRSEIEGEGILETLPAVYVSDANVSMISLLSYQLSII